MLTRDAKRACMLIGLLCTNSNSEISMSENHTNEEAQNGLRKLIKTGGDIAGGAVGGAITFLIGGSAGAILGGAGGVAAAAALKHIGQEASERLLGPREKVRIGGVLAIAAEEIRQRVEKGESVRTDGFFESHNEGRPDAEEVAESILLKSQREAEEKKIPYMGQLFAAVAFDSQISAQMAHQIIKIAEQLTYRQLCILKLAEVKQDFNLKNDDYRGAGGSFTKELYQVLYECLDLYHRGLVHFGGEVAFGPTDVNPGGITIQGLGVDIYNLMKLWTIPDIDITPIAIQLR